MIPVQKVLVRYTVTTGVLEYAVPFALYGTGDVNVSWATAGDTETQTRLAPGSDYSVTVFRDMTGGKVTLADGKVPAGATLAIESAVPLTQELDLSNTATVDTEATEGQLDRMVQMIQQLGDGLSRAVKVNATDSGTPEDLLGSLYKARDDAKDAATAATASEQAAEGSEQAAATSALQAASSEQAAATSAEAADQSRAEAAASAAAASQSATAASQSAEAAAESESKAAGSAASILGLHVEVATLDPGLPASGDYDPETGILHLSIPKGDSGASAIATSTSLGSVMPQTGNDDSLELGTDGKLRVRKASVSQRGSVLASTTAAANAVPQAGVDGKLDPSWMYTGLPLGYIFAWPFAAAPDGCIVLNGGTYSRALYADFFAYIKAKGWTKTETEWQAIAQANGGFCPWYSEGDGSTNFRTPKFAPYQKIALASGDTGKYYEAGLPNIEGQVGFESSGSLVNPSGSFSSGTLSNNYAYATGSPAPRASLKFDASRSNTIYGNSTTVQPESHDWIVCAVAFGVATNVGSVDVANVMSAVGQVQTQVTEAIEIDSSGYSSGQHWVRYKDGRQIIYSDWESDFANTSIRTFAKPFTTNPALIGFDNETIPANTERRGKFSEITGTYFKVNDWAYGSVNKSGCWVAMGIWK